MNDRRKTFNTPLEFWQWAIMEPGKRKAKTIQGVDVWVEYGAYQANPLIVSLGGSMGGLWASRFPLTAVEDEHGAIEEEKPIRDAGEEIMEILSPLGRVAAARSLAAYRALIREEIAAATVETLVVYEKDFVTPPPKWIASNSLRLRPKGDK